MLAVLALLAASCGATQDETTAIAESDVDDAPGNSSQQSPELEESDSNTNGASAGSSVTSGDADIDLSGPVVVEGEITVPLDSNEYTFNGQTGDAISIDVTALNNGGCTDADNWDLKVQVLNPSGDKFGPRPDIYDCRPNGPWEPDTDGTHTILFTGGNGDPNLGTYTATISRLG